MKINKWYYNKSKRNITVSELNLTLKAGQVVDLYKLKPGLRPEYVRYSERFGVLNKKVKSGELFLLDGPPAVIKELPSPKYIESTEMLQTRVRSLVEVDLKDKDFIENLETDYLKDSAIMDDHERARINERFVEDVDLEGFLDPLAEDDD